MFSVHRFLKYIVTAVQIKIKYSVPILNGVIHKSLLSKQGCI